VTATGPHRILSGVTTAVLSGTEHQPQARMALEAALRDEGHLSHAYLFHGPAGTGKRTAARAFAAALLAEGQEDPEDVRRRVLAGVHPDLTWVEPRGAHEILVDDVRTRIVREVALRPFEASRRVFVIADAERMNDESQNALLKTLEEPSPFAHFVLVSSAPGRLLPTIPSRCRQVRFGPVPAQDVAELLAGEGVDLRLAESSARLAGGDVVRARYLAGKGAEQRADAEHAARAVIRFAGEDDAAWALEAPWQPLLDRAAKAGASAERQVKKELERALEDQPRKGRQGFVREQELQARRARRRAHTGSLDQSLELVALWFRDLAAVAAGAGPQAFNADRLEQLEQDAAGREVSRFVRCLELVDDARLRLERNVLEDLALESLFNRLRRVVAS
jgi:DNA polymerase III subunit delta'